MITRVQAIDLSLAVWLSLTALSAAYVAYDAVRRTPEMVVMKWGWVLVTLYTGPVGGALYVLSCQEPARGSHADFVRPLWKQGLGSTIHCLAGDATGIIAAAGITMAMGLRMWQDLVVEYVFGFAFGLLVFQALFMRGMLGGSYTRALRPSFLPEWISMNAVMSAMVPVMVVLMSRDMRSMEPSSLHFWGVMSLATLAGLIVAYPFNVWLVAAGLKHGMGTIRVLGEGGHAVKWEAGVLPHGTHAVPARPVRENDAEGSDDIAGSFATRATEQAMVMRRGATRPQIAAVALLSILALSAGILVAGLAGDLAMAGRMPAHQSGPPAPVHQMSGM